MNFDALKEAHHGPGLGDIRTNVDYIHRLLSLELLMKLDTNNTNIVQAWQYGQATDAVWKDNPVLVEKYAKKHVNDLHGFLLYRVGKEVQSLAEGLDDLASANYSLVPLDPNVYNSLLANLTSADIKAGAKKFFTNRQFAVDNQYSGPFDFRILNDNDNGYKIADVGQLQTLVRLLHNEFNMYTSPNDDLDTPRSRAHYGVRRREILDRKIYMCWKCLKDSFAELSRKMANNYNYRETVTYLDIFYHLAIPATMHPNTLDRMYEKYVKRHPGFMDAVQKARRYSGFYPIDVICEEVARLPCPRVDLNPSGLPNKFLYTQVAPDSLVERYLVTRYLKCTEQQSYIGE